MKHKEIKNNNNYIFIIVMIIVLLLIFFMINVLKVGKINIHYAKDKTTIKVSESKDKEKNIITLFINGNEEIINMKTYDSYLGYKIDYMSDYFNVSMATNKTLLFISKADNNTYMQIELLTFEEYENENKVLTEETSVDKFINYYYFRNKDDLYLKITKCISKDDVNNSDIRLEYMINTLYVN